jgi:hypothetical protein
MSHFVRTRPAPVVQGGYQAYRPYVRQDFRASCAYCLLHELWAAGPENFELDHFFPRVRFPERVNDFYNLYYSCHPCNHIKHDKWPSTALQAAGIGFIDLCQDEFDQHFEEREDGTWKPLNRSAAFTLEMLRLNRDQLVEMRQFLRALPREIDRGHR